MRAEETEGGVEGGGAGNEEDGADREEKKSPFFNILAEWTWGQVVLLRGGGGGEEGVKRGAPCNYLPNRSWGEDLGLVTIYILLLISPGADPGPPPRGHDNPRDRATRPLSEGGLQHSLSEQAQQEIVAVGALSDCSLEEGGGDWG